MRRIALVFGSTAALLAASAGFGASAQAAAQAAGCRPAEGGTFSLRVEGTGCTTGRAVVRAYESNPDQACFDGACTVRARAERWRCKSRILRTGAPVPDNAPLVRGRIRCVNLIGDAKVRWEYTGQGA